MYELPTVNRAQTGVSMSFPAPVGGWNAKDALANMEVTDAVVMENWWPTPGYLQVRAGYVKFATGFPGVVETVAAYKGANSRLFGCSGGNIYDASAQGVIGAPVVTGLNSNRWGFVNFTTTGGVRYLCLFNGADSPQYYDGTNWIAISDTSTPSITGIGFSASQFSHVISHKNRLILGRRDTLELYYLPVGAVGGVANLFNLAPIFRRGGVIVDIETWSVDTGQGIDDRLVIATDQGELAVYQGTDIASASTWSLVGVYFVGGFIGQRSLARYGGDVLAICQYGLMPLSALLLSKVINLSSALTDKINQAINDQTAANANNFGWQLLSYPKGNALILNVPTSVTGAQQDCMNTLSGAWTSFTGWNALCWELYFDDPYFGANQYIGKAWTGTDDAGSPINTDLVTAFNYMGEPGKLKQWTMVRPIVRTDGSPSISYGLNVDFDGNDAVSSPTFTPQNTAVWDQTTWR